MKEGSNLVFYAQSTIAVVSGRGISEQYKVCSDVCKKVAGRDVQDRRRLYSDVGERRRERDGCVHEDRWLYT